jgi:hypothetical protein
MIWFYFEECKDVGKLLDAVALPPIIKKKIYSLSMFAAMNEITLVQY